MEIKDITVQQTIAKDTDYLVLQDPDTGIGYKITKANLFAGLTSGSGSTSTTAVSLTYTSNGDANGLLYYIGTNAGTQPWQNPNNVGIVISASSVGSGTLSYLSDRQDNEFYTGNVPNSWVSIDIGTAKLKCNCYSLRNRNNSNYYLRSWKFQGGDNGINWTDLDVQVNNTFLATPSQWLSLPVATTLSFSKFRLIQTAVDSSGFDFLCLGEIELYGLYTH